MTLVETCLQAQGGEGLQQVKRGGSWRGRGGALQTAVGGGLTCWCSSSIVLFMSFTLEDSLQRGSRNRLSGGPCFLST